MSKKLYSDKYFNIPTFVEAGESAAAKTATTAKMVDDSFVKGMDFLTGDGMTTSCETEVVIDPDLKNAGIIIERLPNDEIRAKVLRNLQNALVAECRNVVASLPANNTDALNQFVINAVVKRAKFQDEKFRVHRLLINQQDKYHGLLTEIFKIVLKRAAESSFRCNCIEAGKESKSKSTEVIEHLVANMMDDEKCGEYINSLLKLIDSETNIILRREGFCNDESESGWFGLDGLDSERFKAVVKVISNSEKKDLEGIPSIACAIQSLKLIVPGRGIKVGGNAFSAYRLIDIVGFTNDGFGSVNELINSAVFSKYNYDGIIYFASIKAINKTHESLLTDILKLMRPAKLMIVSTFMDKDAIFDEDEIPTAEMVQKLNNERKKKLLDMVKKAATDDLHILLPTEEDIICVSNKINIRKHGEYAAAIYNSEQYDFIRDALERAAGITRKKISVGVNRTARYLVPSNQVRKIVGQIINQLGTTIDGEYSKLRDYSGQIHHWTLDAVLWNMLNGREHVSDAKVWRNVHITTYSDMQRICLENLGEFKFSPEVKVGKQEEGLRIKKEFTANLYTELYGVVRNLILTKLENEEPDYKGEIRELALTSKYNKWRVIDDLRLCLMNAVSRHDYLYIMLNDAIDKALLTTFDKILY